MDVRCPAQMLDADESRPRDLPTLTSSITPLVQVLAGTVGVGSVLLAVGVAVRFLAYAMDEDLRGTTNFAPSLPPSDLTFLGAQQMLSPITTIFVAFVIVTSILATRPTIARVRAVLQFRAAGQKIEDRAAVLDKLNTELVREALNKDLDRSRQNFLRDEVMSVRDELQAAHREMEARFRDAERIRDSAEHRTYAVVKFGVAFSSRRVYYGSMVVLVLFLLGQALQSSFPRTLIENASIVGSVGPLIYDLFGRGTVRPVTLLLAAGIAIAGATATGAMAYRSPIGLFEFAPGASVPDGRYASIGETGGIAYVVSCSATGVGVVAVPSTEVKRVTFLNALGESRGPSLWDLITVPGSSPRVGALLGCSGIVVTRKHSSPLETLADID